MKILTLSELRWVEICPNHLRLMTGPDKPPVDLIDNGAGWTLQGYSKTIPTPSRDAGARMLATALRESRQ